MPKTGSSQLVWARTAGLRAPPAKTLVRAGLLLVSVLLAFGVGYQVGQPDAPAPTTLRFPDLEPKRIVGDTPRATVLENLLKLSTKYLQPFGNRIWRSSYMTVFMRGDCVGCFLVQIKNGKVWVHDPRNVRSSGELFHQLRMREILHWTTSALRAGWDLNEVEFVASTGDGLVTADHRHEYRLKPPERHPHPIFTAIHCNISSNIPFPMVFGDLLRRAFTDSAMYRKGVDLAEWDEQMLAIQDSPSQRLWAHKTEKAMFRGSIRASAFYREKAVAEKECNNSGRGTLGLLADKHPDLLDVGLSGPCLSRYFRSQPVPLERQQAFKYLIYAEGNSFWADRLAVMLFSSAAVFKQETPCGQFFEPLMREGNVYVGVDYFFNDLVDKIKWARGNDKKLQDIATSGSRFANDYLSSSGVTDYVGTLLSEYGKRLVRKKITVQRNAMLYYPVLEGAKSI